MSAPLLYPELHIRNSVVYGLCTILLWDKEPTWSMLWSYVILSSLSRWPKTSNLEENKVMVEASVIEGYIDIVVLEVIILLGKCAIMCKNAVHTWTLWKTAHRGPTLFTSPLNALYSPQNMSQWGVAARCFCLCHFLYLCPTREMTQ